MNIKKLYKYPPFSKEILISLFTLIVLIFVAYGSWKGILVTSILVSSLTDGLFVATLRQGILNIRLDKNFAQARIFWALVSLLISVVLHVVAYNMIGKKSLILTLPTLAFLIILYILHKLNYRIRE